MAFASYFSWPFLHNKDEFFLSFPYVFINTSTRYLGHPSVSCHPCDFTNTSLPPASLGPKSWLQLPSLILDPELSHLGWSPSCHLRPHLLPNLSCLWAAGHVKHYPSPDLLAFSSGSSYQHSLETAWKTCMVLFSSQQMPEGAEILHEEERLQAEDFYKLLTGKLSYFISLIMWSKTETLLFIQRFLTDTSLVSYAGALCSQGAFLTENTAPYSFPLCLFFSNNLHLWQYPGHICCSRAVILVILEPCFHTGLQFLFVGQALCIGVQMLEKSLNALWFLTYSNMYFLSIWIASLLTSVFSLPSARERALKLSSLGSKPICKDVFPLPLYHVKLVFSSLFSGILSFIRTFFWDHPTFQDLLWKNGTGEARRNYTG